MKIKMQFGTVKTMIISLVALLAVALIVVDALLLAGVFGDLVNVPVTCVSLVTGVLILAFDLALLLGSYYEFADDKFIANFALFYKVEILYTAVTSVRQNTEKGVANVSVVNDKGGMSDLQLNLQGGTADKVAKELATKSGILVEYYTEEKKDKKD